MKRGESAYADSPFTGEELRSEELLVKNLWEIFPELVVPRSTRSLRRLGAMHSYIDLWKPREERVSQSTFTTQRTQRARSLYWPRFLNRKTRRTPARRQGD